MRRWLPLGLILAAMPAWAQDVMSFDTLLVTSFQASDESLQSEADRLHGELVQALEGATDLLYMDEVPPVGEISAPLYLQSCPPGNYSGCALVVADKLQPQWAMGAFVEPGPEGPLVNMVVIDVASSREVLQFNVALDGTNEVEFFEGVVNMYTQVQDGAFAEIDLRDQSDPEVQRQIQETQAALLASSLAELEESLGEAVRGDLQVIERPKLTKADLEKFEDREGQSPWEALDMSAAEYKRFKNVDIPLADWRRRRQGRFGQILFRTSIGGGKGPFAHNFDARWALDGSTLERVQLEQIQELVQDSNSAVDFELGFGVAPWVEVAGFYGRRSSGFSYLTDQENTNEPVIVEPTATRRPVGTQQYGVRAGFIPMPTYQFRPTTMVGLAWWQGKSYTDVVAVPEFIQPMDSLSLFMLQAGVGVEASAGKNLNIFVRGIYDLVLAGKRSDAFSEGTAGVLQYPPTSQGKTGNGYEVQAGFQLRLGPLWGSGGGSGGSKGGSIMDFEDEDL